MTENSLVFLDTKIVLQNGNLELFQHRKNNTECMTNFKFGVSPKSYKTGLIAGEIYRTRNCTTSDEALDEGLHNLKQIFKKNLFPGKIIDEKINEIKGRNFGENPNKAVRLEDAKNPNFTHVTISLPYTSFRCSTIASKIHTILNKYTPLFKLHIAFSTLKLSSVILPLLKTKKEDIFTSNIVYKFTCSCNQSYIGHSRKLFETRIYQHRTQRSSHVYQHIKNCEDYKSKMILEYGSVPSCANQREYIKKHFKILQKNLTNYYTRITHEGLMITLESPELNKQQKHKSMSLVCECVKSKYTESSKFTDNTGV